MRLIFGKNNVPISSNVIIENFENSGLVVDVNTRDEFVMIVQKNI